MSNTISRRGALAAGAALAVPAVAALPAIAAANPDAELIELGLRFDQAVAVSRGYARRAGDCRTARTAA